MCGFPDPIGVLSHYFELWIDDNFVGPQFNAQLEYVTDFKEQQKLLGQRAAHRVSLFWESSSAIHKELEPFTGHSLLARIILSENFELLERLVGQGVNMNMRYVFRRGKKLNMRIHGMTVLHFAAMQTNADIMKLLVDSSPACPSCARNSLGMTPIQNAYCSLPVLKVLIQECLVEVATFDNNGWTPLHHTAALPTRQRNQIEYHNTSRPFDSAMLLLEGDYQRAIRGAPWFNTKSTKTLLTARDGLNGMTALEIATVFCKEEDSDCVELLRGWESSPLAVPPPTCQLSTETVMFNPQLTPFQSFLAHGVRDLLNDTAIHSMTYQVMGYLTPLDVLSNWNEWREDITTPNPVQCYCCRLRNK